MDKVVQVTVASEAYDVGEGLVKFAGAAKAALKDGFQAGADLPAIVAAAAADLMPIIGEFQAAAADESADKEGFIKAMTLVAGDLYDALKA